MEPKNIAASAVVAIVASVVVVCIGNVIEKAPGELTLKPGATAIDRAVSDAANQAGSVRVINAILRVSVVNNTYGLHWWCDSSPCPATTAAEINKVSSKSVSASLVPRLDGDTVTYDITVHDGEAPAVPELSADDAILLGVQSIKQ